ncbi:MAG: hypothetical protein ACRETM_08485 [Stenotrophobium sp.]
MFFPSKSARESSIPQNAGTPPDGHQHGISPRTHYTPIKPFQGSRKVPDRRSATRYPNVFSSSEMTPFWLFPGTTPGFYVGKAVHGELRQPAGR